MKQRNNKLKASWKFETSNKNLKDSFTFEN